MPQITSCRAKPLLLQRAAMIADTCEFWVPRMRIVAIIAAYNEERFIAGCLEHLQSQGVEAHLLDNESTDRTAEIAQRYLGGALCGMETVPRDGVYRWRRILARKEALASELAADWFLHLDVDEIPLPPRPGTTLAAEIARADEAGYNAVQFDELTFVPTREAPDHDHPHFRRTMRWYYPFASGPLHLVRCWKRQPERVELAKSGGHAVGFPDQRISRRRCRLLHYLFLSREHAERKYGQRRYDDEELRDNWHGWRATVSASTLRLPAQAELRSFRSDAELDPSAPRREHCVLWPEP
jgi:hypothetical protein